MTWSHARKEYLCFRCRGLIKLGERYFFHSAGGRFSKHGARYPSSCRTYRYHPVCKSTSGKKESHLTENLHLFIEAVKDGPKLTKEIPISPQLVNCCYRQAVMMGLHIYKHVFYHRTKEVIFFMDRDKVQCLKRVEELNNANHDFKRQHKSILGAEK